MDVSAYLDIKVVAAADAEFESVSAAMTAIFNRVHQALAEYGEHKIGISFPEYSLSAQDVGSRIRLHGGTVLLKRVLTSSALQSTSFYAKNFCVKPVNPEDVYGHVRVQRLRLEKKKSYEQTTGIEYLSSSSTEQIIPFFALVQKKCEACDEGEFNNYGLSLTHTVPFFMA